jgi:hypothetical protein
MLLGRAMVQINESGAAKRRVQDAVGLSSDERSAEA